MTDVFEARPLGCPPDRPVDYVVKLLQPQHRNDPIAKHLLEREVQVGRHISHPNIVPILESRLDSETPHLVMPRIDGASLGSVIRSVGRVSPLQAIWYARQTAQALEHLHEHGWVHGDVKPDNIMVTRAGHATLIDLAFVLRRGESIYDPGKPLLGSLAYVAPEQLTSANATHPVVDVYSLGVTLFEMLAGRLPFTATDRASLVEAQLRQPAPRLDRIVAVPSEVADLVAKMLAKSPIRRPQSASELIEQLTALEIDSLESRVA